MPIVLVGTVLAVVALVLMPLSAGSLVGLGVVLAVFFTGYFVYYSPYFALFPDLVSDDVRGRSQGAQGALRSAGLLLALAGGGFLLSLWQPLPFLIGAASIAVVTLVFFWGGRSSFGRKQGGSQDIRKGIGALRELVRGNRDVRDWVIANSMWEAAIAALKAFIVLYFTRGLGISLNGAAGALGLVGMAAVVRRRSPASSPTVTAPAR